ncbi:unnamed protein product [Rotaria magnacalcarata]|uniref:DNA-directed primase/polymerase protein n=2 Tax=Rotaria magnacalcarata TaxID=392030 RepID=A0A8S3B8E0_9BILA|nr:unnamed protein product [Rotaria magnacalcarata]
MNAVLRTALINDSSVQKKFIMTTIIEIIKNLFPSKLISHHICDLVNQLPEQIIKSNYIFLSIENDNKTRQFFYSSIEELIALYNQSSRNERSLYEIIFLTNIVKTYVDFEYYIDNNLDINDHCIGANCFLKILHYTLNGFDHKEDLNENYIDIALQQLLVLEANCTSSEYISAIDLNAYSKRQQFRLYDCVKRGQNNFLCQSTYFQFKQSFENSYGTLLKKSIITYNAEHSNLQVVYLESNQFKFKHTDTQIVSLLSQHNQNMFTIIKQHLEFDFMIEINNGKPSFQNNNFNFLQIDKPYDYINLRQQQVQKYTAFVQKLITSDKNHQGYIQSCVRGTYNKDHLFFNIAGNYRFCPRRGSHHKQNRIAILIDTNKQIYTIRCKDNECSNIILTWNSI